MAEPSENANNGLVRARGVGRSRGTFGHKNIGPKLVWKLPPKPLTARSQVNFSLSIVIPTLLTVVCMAALSALLSKLYCLVPNLDLPRSQSLLEIYREYAMAIEPVPASPVSCDLSAANVSAFEKAFIIDLRSQLHLSFAMAKFIDVVWDSVIGQGGRLLLAWISYVVFMDGLARLMETSAISHQLYASIVFQTSSLTSIWYSLKAVSTGQYWRGRAFLAWFGLATIYVLGYPTLMSAATGYVNTSTVRYRVGDNTLIPPNSEQLNHCLRILNAPAAGLEDGYIVQGPSDNELPLQSSLDNQLRKEYPFFYLLTFVYPGRGNEELYDEGGDFVFSSDDTIIYDYIQANNLSTNFTASPRLKFVDFRYTHFDYKLDGTPSYDLEGRPGILPSLCHQGNAIPWDSAVCLGSPYFVWGFSSLLLYIVLSLQLVWTLGMFIVWLDANTCSKLCRKQRKMRGSFRNALDLAEAVREVLGDNLCAYSESEIARQLGKSGCGLQFYTSETETGISHIGISSFKGDQGLHLSDKVLYGGLDKDQG